MLTTLIGTRPGPLRPGRRLIRRGAFTLIELIVVITLIVLVLALALPGLTAMTADARQTSAAQMINGGLTRAYYLAMANMNMTAVRFLPGEWDAPDENGKFDATGRQHLAIYNYVGQTTDPNNPTQIKFGEYFEPANGITPLVLPTGVWAAPLEALSTATTGVDVRFQKTDGTFHPVSYSGEFGTGFVLNGTASQFRFDGVKDNGGAAGDFLNADDFLLAFNPQTGLLDGTPQSHRLRAYFDTGNPTSPGYVTDRAPSGGHLYQRFNFTGVVTYRREAFTELGANATGTERQNFLKETGRPYMAHRFSGGLLSGVPGSQ